MPNIKVNKKDKFRALLTDTIPGDVPVIFSNDGLYLNCHSNSKIDISETCKVRKNIFEYLIIGNDSHSSPYKYSITKDEISSRNLSLMHPRSQLAFCEFYDKYSDALIYLCSKSPASIRAPSKISNSYYSREADKSKKYKEDDIDTLQEELHKKHLSSYFSYRGFNRLYKLFESNKYFELERKYTSMWMIDIANCFGSIYTHTIAWAIKSKKYAKGSLKYRNQFGNKLDTLMQRSNNNETNGIPIGAETSRIFAEIILQKIDCDIIHDIEKTHNLTFKKDYSFFRYVDDYVIFSQSNEVSSKIARTISDNISEFNLYINTNKIRKHTRPFNTNMSNIVSHLKEEISKFEHMLFYTEAVNGYSRLCLHKINRRDSLYKHFINRIKQACHLQDAKFSDVSSYMIAILSNKALKTTTEYRISKNETRDEAILKYVNTLTLLLDLMFFFFTVSQNVVSSYKLAKTIIVLDRFIKNHGAQFLYRFRTRVMENYFAIEYKRDSTDSRKNFVTLENLNILLSTSSFGENYLIPPELIEKYISEEASYFQIISVLYYIKSSEVYDKIRLKIESIIRSIIQKNCNLDSNSESLHLFLDSLSCPFISEQTKKSLLDIYSDRYEALSLVDRSTYLTELSKTYWFVNWTNLDMIKLLERKELISPY